MRLDNEVSEEHINMLEDQGLTVQLVPLCNKRQNLAYCTIQTRKNRLIVGLMCRSIFPNHSLGHIHPASKHHYQSTYKLNNQPKVIFFLPNMLSILLQPSSPSTPGLQVHNS